ncbi:MAG: hypothetical protein AB7F40_00715 [Victivallaceae bacterium]
MATNIDDLVKKIIAFHMVWPNNIPRDADFCSLHMRKSKAELVLMYSLNHPELRQQWLNGFYNYSATQKQYAIFADGRIKINSREINSSYPFLRLFAYLNQCEENPEEAVAEKFPDIFKQPINKFDEYRHYPIWLSPILPHINQYDLAVPFVSNDMLVQSVIFVPTPDFSRLAVLPCTEWHINWGLTDSPLPIKRPPQCLSMGDFTATRPIQLYLPDAKYPFYNHDMVIAGRQSILLLDNPLLAKRNNGIIGDFSRHKLFVSAWYSEDYNPDKVNFDILKSRQIYYFPESPATGLRVIKKLREVSEIKLKIIAFNGIDQPLPSMLSAEEYSSRFDTKPYNIKSSSYNQLIDKVFPPAPKIPVLPPFVEIGTCALIYGTPNTPLTDFIANLATSLATGKSFCRHWTVSRSETTLVVVPNALASPLITHFEHEIGTKPSPTNSWTCPHNSNLMLLTFPDADLSTNQSVDSLRNLISNSTAKNIIIFGLSGLAGLPATPSAYNELSHLIYAIASQGRSVVVAPCGAAIKDITPLRNIFGIIVSVAIDEPSAPYDYSLKLTLNAGSKGFHLPPTVSRIGFKSTGTICYSTIIATNGQTLEKAVVELLIRGIYKNHEIAEMTGASLSRVKNVKRKHGLQKPCPARGKRRTPPNRYS